MVTAAMKLKDTWLLGSYDKPRQHIKKQRHPFANKGPYSQSYDFLIVVYRCESWTIKKTKSWRIDVFELWCWRRLLSIHWTARRSNQSILKEINPYIHWKDWCWSWNSNTLATWGEESPRWKRPWCWERLKARGEGDDKMRWLDGITDSVDMSFQQALGDGEG